MKLASIDFEFFGSEGPNLTLVCATVSYDNHSIDYWLVDKNHLLPVKTRGDTCLHLLQSHILQLNSQDYIFLGFATVAEARCFIQLGFDPRDFQWIDLYSEYRCLANHNHNIQYGQHLIDGKIKTTHPPGGYGKPKEGDSSNPDFNLAAACFKFLGVRIDTQEKEEVREIIISKNIALIEENRERIMKYCASDVRYLEQLFVSMKVEFQRLNPGEDHIPDMLERGAFTADTAWIEHRGMPLNYEATRAFADNVPTILKECQRDINSLFPQIRPFRFNKKSCDYSMNEGAVKAWVAQYIKETGASWVKTPTGELSLAMEVWETYFHFNHFYPRDNFGAQMVRFFKLKQSLNGFMPVKNPNVKKRTFWDSVGPDHRMRPFLGIYGAQSGRNQPQSTGFLFLKPAWMRALSEPPKGRAIVAIDFSSQEFLIAALISQDENMLKAYESGDVYLYFAKLAGAVPWEGTKAQYSKERDLFKSTVLGIQYGMTEIGLSRKLSNDMGQNISEAQAFSLIQKFEMAFPKYAMWKERFLMEYRRTKKVTMPCGWTMWGDNKNNRSVLNVPVQGAGASIMRFSVTRAHDYGLEVVMTLHDALYIECDSDEGSIMTDTGKLITAMENGFRAAFVGSPVYNRANIRLEAKIWGPGLEEDEGTIEGPRMNAPVPWTQSEIMIDKRSLEEYKRFSQYFKSVNYSVLL